MTELTLAASEHAPSKSAAAKPSGSLYYRRWFRSAGPNCQTKLIMALSRRNRERRRQALACITVQLRRSELEALIACGFLGATEQEDNHALAVALHRYLDANPIAGRRP